MRVSPMVTQHLGGGMGIGAGLPLLGGMLTVWNLPTPGFEVCVCQREGPALVLTPWSDHSKMLGVHAAANREPVGTA